MSDRTGPPPPTHVAIIMDGNGRWAAARHLPRTAGHKQGAEAVRRTIQAAGDLGIPYVTLFGFSSENWRRPEHEVRDLMSLLHFYLSRYVADLHKEGARLRVVGQRHRFAPPLIDLIENAERVTRENDRFHLTIALSYGGRDDIVYAARQLAERVRAGAVDPAQIDEAMLARHLYTAELPDPDLIIRTSGEKRISNFLLWQAAYSELVFVDRLWPDFGKADLEAAIREYQGRERRFGKTAADAAR